MKIVRMKLAPDSIFPLSQRYNADCDCTQSTADGGTTWTDTPGIDPRTSTALQLPPYPSADPKCDAAASIVANMKAGLDKSFEEISAVATGATAVTAILGIFEFITGIGLLVALISDFVLSIVSIGIEAVDLAFTPTVYSQLECIFYCHGEGDGTFSPSDFAAIQTDITTTFGEFSTVNIVAQGWLKFLGNVGLSNVASAQHTTGDCSTCDCGWCFEFDWTVNDGGWIVAAAGFGNEGEWVSGLGWRMSALQEDGCSGHGYLNISYPLGLTTDNITGLELWWQNPNPDGGTQFFDQVLSGTLELRQDLSTQISNPNPSFDVTAASCDTVRLVNFQCGQNESVPFYMSKSRFSGTGVCPFGTPNC